MKNVIIIILVIVLIVIAFGIISEYNLIKWKWDELAIGAAALAGPFHFMKNKLNERREEQQNFERELAFRKVSFDQIQRREIQSNYRNESTDTSVNEQQFSTDEPTYG